MLPWRTIEPTALVADLFATDVVGSPVGILQVLDSLTPYQIDLLGGIEMQIDGQWHPVSMDDAGFTFKQRQQVRRAKLEQIGAGCDRAVIADLPTRYAAAAREASGVESGIKLPFSPLISGALASGFCSYADLRDKLHTRDALYMVVLSAHQSIVEWVMYDNQDRKAKRGM